MAAALLALVLAGHAGVSVHLRHISASSVGFRPGFPEKFKKKAGRGSFSGAALPRRGQKTGECAAFPARRSKQIAVGTGSNQLQNQGVPNHLVDEQPVRLDVALAHILIVSGIRKRVIPIGLRQRLLAAQERDDSFQFLRVAAPLQRKLVISPELPRKLRLSIERLHQVRDAVKRAVEVLALFRRVHRRVGRLVRLVRLDVKGKPVAAQRLPVKNARRRAQVHAQRLKERRRPAPSAPAPFAASCFPLPSVRTPFAFSVPIVYPKRIRFASALQINFAGFPGAQPLTGGPVRAILRLCIVYTQYTYTIHNTQPRRRGGGLCERPCKRTGAAARAGGRDERGALCPLDGLY